MSGLALTLAVCSFWTPQAGDWEEDLSEMGYWLFRASNLNVVNGLNLSREQAVRLREIAREIEEAVPRPDLDRNLPPAFAEFRAAVSDLCQVLLRGEEIPEELRARVVAAREREAAWIEAGLRPALAEDARLYSCARCHGDPARAPAGARGTVPAAARDEQVRSHMAAGLGQRGWRAAARVAPEIGDFLTSSQKAILSDFSCCLIPPPNLRDPVRVGQAAVADWKREILEGVRQVPEALWPRAKEVTLDRLAESARMVTPGLSDDRLAEIRRRVGDVFEEARRLSDIDFELRKEELCRALDGAGAQPAPAEYNAYQAAFFLLVPGAVEAYDALLSRLDRQAEAAAQARPADLGTIEGAECCDDGTCALDEDQEAPPAAASEPRFTYHEFDGIYLFCEPANPEVYRELLPGGFEAPDRPLVQVFTADYYEMDARTRPYRESAVSLLALHDGKLGWYCLSMPVTTEESMRAGRDFLGLPKVVREVTLTRGDAAYEAVTRGSDGTTPAIALRLAIADPDSATAEQDELLATVQGLPVFSVVDGRVVEVGGNRSSRVRLRQAARLFPDRLTLRFGEGTVRFGDLPGEPWTRLDPGRVVLAYYMRLKATWNLVGGR